MRMRKLPWAEDFLKEQQVVIKEPATFAGKWKTYLNKDCLHVEIGTGKGDYLLQMSQKDKASGWIGVEKNNNVAALAVRKYTNMEEPGSHVAFINADAEEISSWFKPGEIDVIHLNFSDPWPKKRAHKKRLSNEKFIRQYADILSEDGEIQMKTDNSSLFEYSLIEFQKCGWFLHDVSVDFRRTEHEEDAISEYERKFMDKGQPIYRAVWKKVPNLNEN
ncbi:tRNA (guanosine(46)-N7)-methyltransferase TrmB [[Eubacterium] hominis]|uniref:tRNA (guanosine(46)-N7)-methyltransferase TrmB n=1 Tax=[Eubacterium] hominis TaxID=2764325 RepID=UPI003A4DA538